MAALFTAYHLKVKAIAALTQSGSTALWMSRIHCGVPIFALTPEIRSRYRMSLYRDVYPLLMRYIGHDREEAAARGRAHPHRVGCRRSRATPSC
jgi:pyruvate kinase